jgi:uncharacterized membrane protein YeaQ/YmgE (transglycosylase-associated protein family)
MRLLPICPICAPCAILAEAGNYDESLSLYNLAVAAGGAMLFLVVYHAIRRTVIGRRVL